MWGRLTFEIGSLNIGCVWRSFLQYLPQDLSWGQLSLTAPQAFWIGGASKHRSGFPGDSDGKESTCNSGNPGSIPGPGRSPGEGNSNPLQYSCLENPMDWWATVHGASKSQTWLSNWALSAFLNSHQVMLLLRTTFWKRRNTSEKVRSLVWLQPG